MKIQKFRWSKVYESTEEELTDFLQARNITAERWVAEEFKTDQHPSSTDELTIWCAEGSFTLRYAGSALSMQPGDGIHLPKGIPFETTAGISGCVWYQQKRLVIAN